MSASQRRAKLPPEQLSGSLAWARMNSHKARPFSLAWDGTSLIPRVVVCRMVGVAELNAQRAWSEIPGDVQCFILARYFVMSRELATFALALEVADS